MIEYKRLNSVDLIDEAGALLYQIYIVQYKWSFSYDNPSDLRIITKNKRKILIDKFTANAVWFGAFDGEQMIGCARLSGLDENVKLEIEAYPITNEVRAYLSKSKNSCLEITKSAVKKEYQSKGIIKNIFLMLFEYCQKHHLSIFACTHHTYLIKLFSRVEFPLKIEQAFKYDDIDPMPVNFYYASYEKKEVEHIIYLLKLLGKSSNDKSSKLFEALELVAPVLPTPVYWHDINGVVLGINEHCLKAIGTSREIVGKTPYEFYPKEIAEHILKHNEKVMLTGEVLSQEEIIKDITTGQPKYFASIKAPLYDDNGKVIGIVGSSIDITAEKEAQELRIINQQYQVEAKSDELTKSFVNEINYTIQSHINKRLKLAMGQEFSLTEDDTDDISLTKRERLILYCLINGKDSKWIANYISKKEAKDLSHTTVVAFINKGLYKKLNVTNIPDLVEKAQLMQLIETMPDDIFN